MSAPLPGTLPFMEITDRTIEGLVEGEHDETLFFEFKAGIEGGSEDDKYQMRKAIASFANTFGGFLFLGVLDKRSRDHKQGLDRVIGLPRTEELGRRIVQKYLREEACTPLVPIEDVTVVPVHGRAVGVVRIPRSGTRPHGIKSAIDRPLEFWVRGPGTAKPMDYVQLVNELDQRRERRGWLNALFADLQSTVRKAKQIEQRAGAEPVDEVPPRFHSIVQTSLGDLLRVLGEDAIITEGLLPLKDLLDEADASREYFEVRSRQRPPNIPYPPPSADYQFWREAMRQLKLRMDGPARQITYQADRLLNHLVTEYPTVRDRSRA